MVQQITSKTYAVCNTGPLISAFQSDSFHLLSEIFVEIHISPVCVGELIRHGWANEVQVASPTLVIKQLTGQEEQQAQGIAKQIAFHPDTNDPVADNHLGEAQAITLALRKEHRNSAILLDELAARAVARRMKLKLSGFPGVLLLAVRSGVIEAEELKMRLEKCRQQGTHYGTKFIQQVYEMAIQDRRAS